MNQPPAQEVRLNILPSQVVKHDDGDVEVTVTKSIVDTKPAKKLTAKQEIEQAVEDVRLALLENMSANKAVVEAGQRKTRAHYTLQKAKERLNALSSELMGK